MKIFALLVAASSALLAQPYPLEELIAAARLGPAAPGLKDRITKTLPSRRGTAIWGQDYLFIADSPAPVTVSLDGQPAVAMTQVEGSTLWMLPRKMRTGVTHSLQFYA